MQESLAQALEQQQTLLSKHQSLQAQHQEQQRVHQQVVGESCSTLTQITELETRSVATHSPVGFSIDNRGRCKCCYTSCCSASVTAGTGSLNVAMKRCSSSCAEGTCQGLHDESLSHFSSCVLRSHQVSAAIDEPISQATANVC